MTLTLLKRTPKIEVSGVATPLLRPRPGVWLASLRTVLLSVWGDSTILANFRAKSPSERMLTLFCNAVNSNRQHHFSPVPKIYHYPSLSLVSEKRMTVAYYRHVIIKLSLLKEHALLEIFSQSCNE